MAVKKATEEKKDALVAAEKNLPATTGLMSMISQEDVSGFENVKPSDTSIPFIGILQSLSPQVKRGHAKQIPGAAEGMLFNTVTQEAVEGPLSIIPCAFQKAFIEWVPRENGGGFVKQHPDDSCLVGTTKDTKNNDVLANGNHIVATAYHFVLVVKPSGILERAVISMTKSQLKKSRRWLSQMMNLQVQLPNGKTIRPPMFSHTWEVSTVLEQKDSYSWYGFTVGNPKILESMDAYTAAKVFHDEITAGNVVVKPPEEDIPVDESNTGNDAGI